MEQNTNQPKRDVKGIWIPITVWENTQLSVLDKVIFAEIDSLDGERGCIASNEYLCKFLGIQLRTLQRGISLLKKLGLIWEEGFDGRNRVLRSSLSHPKPPDPVPKTIYENFDTSDMTGQEKGKNRDDKFDTPPVSFLSRPSKDIYNIGDNIPPIISPPSPPDGVAEEKIISPPAGEDKLSPDAGERKLCDYFLLKMKGKKPDFTGSITKTWLAAAKWLMKHRTPEQIRKLIDWTFDHHFWSTVIHCPASLKKNITSLEVQMTQKKPEQQSSEKNREVAKTLPNHPDIVVCSDHVGFKHGPMKYIPVNYDDREFAVKLKNELALLGINL